MESCDTPLKMACCEYSITLNCSGGAGGWGRRKGRMTRGRMNNVDLGMRLEETG